MSLPEFLQWLINNYGYQIIFVPVIWVTVPIAVGVVLYRWDNPNA